MSKFKERAQALLSQGKMEEALPILEKISNKKPKDAENWALLGFTYGDLGVFNRAKSSLQKSLAINSKAAYTYRVHRALAGLLEGEGWYREAIEHYMKSIRQNPIQTDCYLNLGNCLKQERRIDEAIDAYMQVLKSEPDNFQACRNIGQLYEQASRLDDARIYTELALKYAPKDVESHFQLAQLDLRDKKLEQAKDRLESLLKMNMPDQHRAMVSKELGRVLEKMGNYQAAFELLSSANQSFEASYIEHKDESGLVEYRSEIDAYRNIITHDMASRWSATEGALTNRLKIVFLVGFPRSGTTLTEQVMESHPDFIATHEIPVLPRLVRDVSSVINRPFNYPADMDSLSDAEVMLLRDAYMQRMEESLHNAINLDKFLLDKLPLNIIHLGFIARVFPEARILVALRDPRDVCLSCFTQTFSYNQAMRQYLDIEDTAQFYSTIMTLWFHYKEVLDINVIETRYEDIVDDLEAAARRILKFVGVEWNAEVMNFYNSAKKRHVFTPSYQGVTQPIYRGAIGKWKNYEQELQSIMPVLSSYILKHGY